ncbi:MAG: hypothetical protein FWD78_09635 [Treponema sp.]|nr:hypothetical protein [Treponema sp.]
MFRNKLNTDSVNLCGEWFIAFDAENKNKTLPPDEILSIVKKANTPIRVPSCWEEIKPGYDGVAWYLHDFNADNITGKIVRIRFNAVNYYAEVWLNGVYLGNHEGGYTPFEFDVTANIKNGPNNLLVRVVDPPKDEIGIDGMILKETPCWREWESFNFGGIWQPVELLVTEKCYINDVYIEPLFNKKSILLNIETICKSEPAFGSIGIKVSPKDQEWALIGNAEMNLLCGGVKKFTAEIPLANPVPWSCENPYLYNVDITLECSGKTHHVRELFGFRELNAKDGKFILNGKEIILKGGFHEGFFPITIAYPKDKDFARKDILSAKKAGFNLLRYWQIPIHPMVLDAADELGMMLCNEPPIEWIAESPHVVRRCSDNIREMVLRDRNHPSVVMWCILNESSWLPDFGRKTPSRQLPPPDETPSTIRYMDEFCLLARELDTTRIIIDESGGWIQGEGIRGEGLANIYLPYSSEAVVCHDIHIYRPAPINVQIYDEMNTIGDKDKITFISEYGYGSVPSFTDIIAKYKKYMDNSISYEDYEQFISLDKSLRECFTSGKLGEIFESPEELCRLTQIVQSRGNKMQLEALLTNPKVNGYVTHAYSAGGLILGAEMVDVFRDPKPVCTDYLKAQSPFRIVLKKPPLTGYSDFPIEIDITLINEAAVRADAELRLEIKSKSGQSVYSRQWNITINGERLQKLLCSGVMINESKTGTYTIGAKLLIDGVLLTQDEGQRFFSRKFLQDKNLAHEHAAGAVLPPADFITSRPEILEKFISRGTDNNSGANLHIVLDDLRYIEPEIKERIKAAKNNIRNNGGTIIFIEPFRGESRPRRYDAVFPEITSAPFYTCGARGNWIPASHYAYKNPVFQTLDSSGLLGDEFGEIIPRIAFGNIQEQEQEVLAGCIFMNATIWDKPMDFSIVSTFSSFKLGKGGMVICQYRLEDAIGKDPVADLFLHSLLEYYQNRS